MKHLNTYITEYIIKKKLDKPIDSEYKYHPKSKDELIENIKELISKDIYDFNCIDTSEIIDMTSLFDAGNYNKPLNNIDISKWNVHNVKNMKGMFFEYNSFNCDLSGWDVSKVKDMSYMFSNCEKFDCNLGNWNIKNVKAMNALFSGCYNFTGKGLENWDVSNVENMEFMFYDCLKFNCNLNKWNVNNANIYYMLYNRNKLKNKPSWYKE